MKLENILKVYLIVHSDYERGNHKVSLELYEIVV